MLLAHLPPDSATAQAVAGDAYEAPWSRVEQLLAALYDSTRLLIWQNENQGRKTPTRRPRPLPRPGVADDTVQWGKPAPLSEVKAILSASRPGADVEVEGVAGGD